MTVASGKPISLVMGKLSTKLNAIDAEVIQMNRKLSMKNLFYSETKSIANNIGRRGVLFLLKEFNSTQAT